MSHKILAVDPGDQRIGLAVSDESGTIANPLMVIKHVSRLLDAATIAQIALEQGASRIVVGQALDSNNRVTPQGRKSARLAGAIEEQTRIPVVLWDEGGSTQQAQEAGRMMKIDRRKRSGHRDDIAATIILQNYLDTVTNTP